MITPNMLMHNFSVMSWEHDFWEKEISVSTIVLPDIQFSGIHTVMYACGVLFTPGKQLLNAFKINAVTGTSQHSLIQLSLEDF